MYPFVVYNAALFTGLLLWDDLRYYYDYRIYYDDESMAIINTFLDIMNVIVLDSYLFSLLSVRNDQTTIVGISVTLKGYVWRGRQQVCDVSFVEAVHRMIWHLPVS